MINKLLLFISGILLSSLSYSQYQFTTSLGTYVPLSNSISLNNGNVWDRYSTYQVYFNFNFYIGSQVYNALNVEAGGGLHFPGLGTKRLRVFTHPDSGYLLGDRDSTNSRSPISYKIDGAIGNRILKIEWKNAGFREFCSSSDTADFIDYQIWLYEGTQKIEVRFGNSNSHMGSYGNPGCNTGVFGTQFKFQFASCNNMLSLTGPAALPSYGFNNHCIWQPGITVSGTPPNGIIYTLNGSTTDLNENRIEQLKIYPNPVEDYIIFKGTKDDFFLQNVVIFDQKGKKILSSDQINVDIFDVKNLSPGSYYIQYDFRGERFSDRFLKL